MRWEVTRPPQLPDWWIGCSGSAFPSLSPVLGESNPKRFGEILQAATAVAPWPAAPWHSQTPGTARDLEQKCNRKMPFSSPRHVESCTQLALTWRTSGHQLLLPSGAGTPSSVHSTVTHVCGALLGTGSTPRVHSPVVDADKRRGPEEE